MTHYHKCNKQGHQAMNAKLEPCIHQDLKVTAKTVRNLDIDPLSADPNPCGHQTIYKNKEVMDISITRITIQGKVVTNVKSMDTSLRIA